MNYKLLPEPQKIRQKFIDTFVLSYSEFISLHKEYISGLQAEFNEEYYNQMFMWDRIIKSAREISFSDALALLKNKTGEILFLTEFYNSTEFSGHEFTILNAYSEFTAASYPQELAECISHEWFTMYELYEKDSYRDDWILPQDLYVFDKSFSWCLIFTHETDWETESADSRVCLYVEKVI